MRIIIVFDPQSISLRAWTMFLRAPKVGVPQDVYAIDVLVTQIEQAKRREKKLGFEVRLVLVGQHRVVRVDAADHRRAGAQRGGVVGDAERDVYAIDVLVTQIEQAKRREKKLGFEVLIETALGPRRGTCSGCRGR
jgi:hypothetical protein